MTTGREKARALIRGWEEQPPTPRQLSAIARMCMALGIREPLEEKPRTRREARDLMYELRDRLRLKR